MAKLTSDQYIAKLRKQMKELEAGKPLRIAAQTVHAMRVERIFDTGSVAKGYNTTNELWVADKDLRKNGNHRGKTGKPIKTTYFKSYFDLKQKQGFNPNTVNFRLTNDLQMDFANSNVDSGTGKSNSGTPIKVNNQLYIEALRRPENQDKLAGLKKKYGDFTVFYANERKVFLDIMKVETLRLLRA